ncbi:MAG: ABC transporter permease, partial [Metallibacterium sp.]
MLGYAFQLALRGFRRNTVLTALMVLAVALGIGVAMSMFTVLHNLAGNPLPQRGDEVFHPQIDPRPADLPGARRAPPDNLTYIDALNLYHLDQASQRALMSANWLPLRSTVAGNPLRMETTRATTRGFFPMFGVPFQYGAAWSEQDDTRRAQVVVISQKLNDQLFGGADSVGRELIIATRLFRIVGVIKPWNPQPHFWDLDDGAYGAAAQIYLPFFTWLELPQDYGYGPMDCWGDNPGAGTHNPKAAQCTWAQYWVQLNTPAQVRAYRDLLV